MLACFCTVKMVKSAPGRTPDCTRSNLAKSTTYKNNIKNVHAMLGCIAALLKDAFSLSKTCMPRLRFALVVCRKRPLPPLIKRYKNTCRILSFRCGLESCQRCCIPPQASSLIASKQQALDQPGDGQQKMQAFEPYKNLCANQLCRL